MPLIKLPRWWAYLDDQGVIRIKKYVSDRAIQNCEQMPFCRGIFDPFEAANYQEAKLKIQEFLRQNNYYEKKQKGEMQ